MQRSFLALPLLASLALTLACPAAPSDEAGGESGGTEGGEGDGDGEEDDDKGDGDGDGGDGDGGDGDGGDGECAAACAVQAECGVIGQDDVADCARTCEAYIEASEVVRGSACAEAQLAFQICALVSECDDPDDYYACEEVGIESFFACTETEIPEIDAMCECMTADEEPGLGDPLSPKESCVMGVTDWTIEDFIADGQPCLDALTDYWGCMADSCEDPSCSSEPYIEPCLCPGWEEEISAACPSPSDFVGQRAAAIDI